MTAIAHLKTTKRGIRCDRFSPLGNPFLMRRESERDAVIEGFRAYTWGILHSQQPIDAARAVAEKMGLTIADSWRVPSRDEFVSTT